MHQMTNEISNLWGKLKMERPRKANTHVSGKQRQKGDVDDTDLKGETCRGGKEEISDHT